MAKRRDGRTPLSLAVEFSPSAMVELLLSQGTDINLQDGYGMTLVHWASRSSNVETLKLLLQLAKKSGFQGEVSFLRSQGAIE